MYLLPIQRKGSGHKFLPTLSTACPLQYTYKALHRQLNSFDTDQDQHSVGPDLGPNCLQRLSADDKFSR